MSETIAHRLLNIQVHRDQDGSAPHKPLLLLLALGKLANGDQRLMPFIEVDSRLGDLLERFAPRASARKNTHYPFGKLENDGVWEIEHSAALKRTSVGHLLRSELIDRHIKAGLTNEIYTALSQDRDAVSRIARLLINKFLPETEPAALMEAVGLVSACVTGDTTSIDRSEHRHHDIGHSRWSGKHRTELMDTRENGFIAYLNSLHNLTASGSNSLAESQALSPYFGDLYQPFPVVSAIKALLTDGTERVVVLTGHAGDGKSTVALDVYKELKGIPQTKALDTPFQEREDLDTSAGLVRIVKDMSELSAGARRRRLEQAFGEPGRWLIVSNTGPLLQSLVDYATRVQTVDLESEILALLNRPVETGDLDPQQVDGFGKPLVILNLTRLDNVKLGAKLLRQLIQHPGWQQCQGCDVEPACPLALNRRALQQSLDLVVDRVRWLFRRVSDYEQRLTLRQIVGQLAYALTGGMGCVAARDQVITSSASGADRATLALQQILFSEGFFGCGGGRPRAEAESLRAIALLRRSLIGGPAAVDFERGFALDAGGGWAELPEALKHVGALWQRRAGEPEGAPARAALRRMALIFGRPRPGAEAHAESFFDAMLRSPGLRDLDAWQQAGSIPRSEQKRLRIGSLHVLLEAYSGFSAAQFRDRIDRLYLTLRRPDRAVVQPTQLIVASMPFDDFRLEYDPTAKLPRVIHRNSGVSLTLSLPLLDYIRRRDAGELADGLSPIHQAQLDRFQAELLDAAGQKDSADPGEVHFLRGGIDGKVDVSHYYVDEDKQKLVVE